MEMKKKRKKKKRRGKSEGGLETPLLLDPEIRYSVSNYSIYVYHVEVGVITSRVLLALDFREPGMPSRELALVLGREILCGDCASPVKSGGVGAADVSMGGGSEGLLWICRSGTALL